MERITEMEARVARQMLREMEIQIDGMVKNARPVSEIYGAEQIYTIASHFVWEEKPCGFVLTEAGEAAIL